MKTSESIAQIADALVKAQGQLEAVTKSKKVTISGQKANFNYKYADLAQVYDACREALSKNGLAVLQDATTSGNLARVVTRVVHSSGEWIESDPLEFRADGDIKALGSAITYLRRYSIMPLLGIAAEDEIGRAHV